MWALSRLRVVHYIWISEDLQHLEYFSSKRFWRPIRSMSTRFT